MTLAPTRPESRGGREGVLDKGGAPGMLEVVENDDEQERGYCKAAAADSRQPHSQSDEEP